MEINKMQSDTILTLGLIGIGGYAVYKYFGAATEGISKAVTGTGNAISTGGNALADVVSGASDAVQKVESQYTKGFDQLTSQLLDFEKWIYDELTGKKMTDTSTTQGGSFNNYGSSTVKAENFGAVQSTAVVSPKPLTAGDVILAARASGNSSIQNLRDTAFTAIGINAAMVH